MSALRTRPGVTKIAATLWEVLSAAVNLVMDLAPIRKLAKVRKIALFAVSLTVSHDKCYFR